MSEAPQYRYDPATIEPKWQKHWLEQKTFRAAGPGDPGFDATKPKYYVLDMFPYPSGAGLHVGHPEGYTATDILARYKRMRGFNVLHPMGWDAYGLPAEQYAIKTGTHPSVTTAQNIETFRRQIQALGFSYDWDREVDTTDPKYYRWTQWIFNLLYDTWVDETGKGRPIEELPAGLDKDKHRLAYLDEIPVWWCAELGTVLANEEVIDGRSERGSHPCVRLPLKQWMFRITAYAHRLLKDLDVVDWPEETRKQQSEWIGESHGAEVWFPLAEKHQGFEPDGERTRRNDAGELELKIFTTRPDTLFGATYMVLAPEHPLVSAIMTAEQQADVVKYREAVASKSDLDRTSLGKEKTGVFTGAYAVNPVNGAHIPVWIADYVLYTYGTGAIMAVPGHDERDNEFAKTFNLPIVQVVQPPEGNQDECFTGEGTAINSAWIEGLPSKQAQEKMIELLETKGKGNRKTTYRLRDWIFSRQRYWGEPFPILHTQDGGHEAVRDLPVRLPDLADYKPSGKPEPPLAKATEWVNATDSQGRPARRETNTMPNWAGSCWYYLRFIDPDNENEPWDREKEKYWMPVDLYVGGREHAVLHLLYARFWHKVLYDRGYVSTPEPFGKLFHQGMILSFSYQDRETKVLIPSDEVEETSEGVFMHKGKQVDQVVAKMSKSLKNVINPDDVLREFGADAMRLYEMYMGPLDITKPWNPRDVVGMHRFLGRVWRLLVDVDKGTRTLPERGSEELERHLHRCIKKVTDDLERMAFNTAISAMMIFVNEATPQLDKLSKSQAERFVQLVAVFAPHLGEELWQRLGHTKTLTYEPWPTWDEALLVDSTIEVPVQVNGKVRTKLVVAVDLSQEELEKMARDAVANYLEGKTVRKVVVIPKRMVNVVVG